MLRKLVFASGIWFLATSPALAWWNTGHMITAQIALDQLKPEVRHEAERLIAVMDPMEPDPMRHNFVPAAVWMDDTKGRGLTAFNRWHYINIPYNADGLAKVPSAPDENIVTTMESMAATLENDRTSDFEKAFTLRVLLHLFGDVHQPFHAVGKVTEKYPDGDWGGNRTPVTGMPHIKNIHAFWDSIGGLFPPTDPSKWKDSIPAYAHKVEKDFPRLSFASQQPFAPESWARESYHLAVTQGYQPLPADGHLSPEYIRNTQQICERRLALGGYRLADFLNQHLK